MSLWEFEACVAGWKRVHGAAEGPAPPTNEEFDAAVAATMH